MIQTVIAFGDHPVIEAHINGATTLTSALVAQLNSACDRAAEAGAGSVVLLHMTGSRERPMASAWPGAVDIYLVSKWEQALQRLEQLNAITIAVAERACGGGVLEVLLAADYRIAAENLLMRLYNHSGEIWPGMGIHRLVNQVGIARSRRAVLFGLDVTATEAVELRLVDEVVADVGHGVAAFAASLISLDLTQIPIRRRLLLEPTPTSHESALGAYLAAGDRAHAQRLAIGNRREQSEALQREQVNDG